MKISGLISLVAGHSCWQEHAGIVGSPLEIVKAVNPDDCFSACYDHNGCNAIAFKNEECHLMAEVTFTNEEGTLAALRGCSEKPAATRQLRHQRRSKCKRDGHRFHRFNRCLVRHSRVSGRFIGKACTKHAGGCAELCHTTKGCLNFTFERGAGRCKHGGSRCLLMGDAVEQVHSPGHTSGSMKCFYPNKHTDKDRPSDHHKHTDKDRHHKHTDKDCACGMSECMKNGVRHTGAPLKVTLATCAVDCAFDCARARVCKHFVFYQQKSKCVLLKKLVLSRRDADAVSGSMSCLFPDIHSRPTTLAPTLAPTTLAPTTLAPTTFAPTTLAPTTLAPTTLAPTSLAPTTPAPTSLVSSVPTTLPATSITVPTNVAPFTTIAPMTETYTSAASTTNSLYHDRTTKEDYASPCYERSTLFEGPTMASLLTTTVARCHQLCFTREGCEKFSWRSDTTICELKNTTTSKKYSEPAVSGEMSCFHPEMYTTSAPVHSEYTSFSEANDRCFERGVRYGGHSLQSTDATTHYECAELCLSDNICEQLTFVNGRCDLFVGGSKSPCPECISASWDCLEGAEY